MHFGFEYHTFLHHSQTDIREDYLDESFEYHTFLHHSQTPTLTHLQNAKFEYHTTIFTYRIIRSK